MPEQSLCKNNWFSWLSGHSCRFFWFQLRRLKICLFILSGSSRKTDTGKSTLSRSTYEMTLKGSLSRLQMASMSWEQIWAWLRFSFRKLRICLRERPPRLSRSISWKALSKLRDRSLPRLQSLKQSSSLKRRISYSNTWLKANSAWDLFAFFSLVVRVRDLSKSFFSLIRFLHGSIKDKKSWQLSLPISQLSEVMNRQTSFWSALMSSLWVRYLQRILAEM